MPHKRNISNELEGAVKFLTTADDKIKVRGNVLLTLSLQTLENVATTKGLSPLYISQLVDAIVSKQYAESIVVKLVKKLIPSSVVPEKAVLQVVSWMCTNKPSNSVQVLLVRWILLVYDYMDNRDNLHKLYGILFYFLENQTLAPHVSQLLYFLTRREDVRLFRIKCILQLQKKLGVQPYLTGLLSLYKLYYPSLVLFSLSRTHKSFFRSYDRTWSETIRKVQIQNRLDIVEPALQSERLQPSNNRTVIMMGNKRRKSNSIPDVYCDSASRTFVPAQSLEIPGMTKMVPFVQILSFKDMLTHAEKIEFPSQIGAVLKNSLLKQLLCYSADKVTATRLRYWLYDMLCEEFLYHQGDYIQNDNLLHLLVEFTEFCQEGVPVVDYFLMKYLLFWNGEDHRTCILQLLARCRLYPFEKLKDLILEPLRKLYFTSSVYFKCQVVSMLTDLVRNYAAFQWPRYMEILQVQKNKELTGESKYCHSVIFLEEVEQFEPVEVIQDLISYISRQCVLGLLREDNNSLLQHCVLSFLELVSSLHQLYNVPFVMLSTPEMFYRLTFTESAMGLSRVCSALCNYKAAFDSLKAQRQSGKVELPENDGTDTIPFCNGLLMDTSSAIWRNRPFHKIGPSNPFFNFDLRDYDDQIPTTDDCFSIYMYQALIGYAKQFLKKTDSDIKKIDPRQIRPHRQKYTAFLNQENLCGISKFLSTFIKPRLSSSTLLTPSRIGLSRQ